MNFYILKPLMMNLKIYALRYSFPEPAKTKLFEVNKTNDIFIMKSRN